MQVALRNDLVVVAWLAASIANVARLRFFSEDDIAGSSSQSATTEIRQASAILQNTFEQVGLAVIAHMVLAATLSHPKALLDTLVGLFALGRFLFWMGYRHGPGRRALGFAMTFYPSVGALIVSATVLSFGWSV